MTRQNLLTAFVLFGLLMFSTKGLAQFLSIPVEGVEGVDWTIVNYVDWKDTGFVDHHCGTKAYDGHQGTDFTLRSFKQMDSGVNVLAAASGRVTFVKDGEFDRETVSDVSKGLGNYIAIRHPNGYYSYYGHLKKGSLKVAVNDSVESGQAIAQIGSSGNSTDPHLHFELYYDSLYVVDPFTGTCGNPNTLWIIEPSYDTSLRVWDFGMHKQELHIDSLRERVETLKKPYLFVNSPQTKVVFWAHLLGLKKGDVLTLKWYQPDSSLWFKYDYNITQDWWYFYYWAYIDGVNLPLGDWYCELHYDSKLIATQKFEVVNPVSVQNAELRNTECDASILSKQNKLVELLEQKRLQVYTLQGKEVQLNTLSDIPKMPVILKIRETNGHYCLHKYQFLD